MEKRYQDWITAYIAEHAWRDVIGGDDMNGTLKGLCSSTTQAMVTAFPELTRVPGYVTLEGGYSGGAHWWCEDKDGTIIDPTVGQWKSPPIAYRKHEGPIPLHRCMNCGEDVYDTKYSSLCSAECEKAFTAYVMGDHAE